MAYGVGGIGGNSGSCVASASGGSPDVSSRGEGAGRDAPSEPPLPCHRLAGPGRASSRPSRSPRSTVLPPSAVAVLAAVDRPFQRLGRGGENGPVSGLTD